MSPIPASAWARGVSCPASTRRHAGPRLTRSLNFLVTVLVIWCWALLSQAPDAPVTFVDLPLGLPPAPGNPSVSLGLGPLPSPQLPLHLVGGFGILGRSAPSESVPRGLMPVSMPPGLGGPFRFGAPAARQSFRQMYHRPFSLLMLASWQMPLGQGAGQLDAAQAGEFHPSLTVVPDFLDAAGRQE